MTSRPTSLSDIRGYEAGSTLNPVQEHCVEILGRRVAPQTISRWVLKNGLPAIKIAGSWCTTREEIEDFLARRSAARVASTPSPPLLDDDLRAAGLLDDAPQRDSGRGSS